MDALAAVIQLAGTDTLAFALSFIEYTGKGACESIVNHNLALTTVLDK